MAKTEDRKILLRFYQSQDRYERLARELHRVLDEDERFPTDAVYTVKHRLKDGDRLIEKIHQNNNESRKKRPIDDTTFQDRIDDLLGLRIICLRLSDLEKLKAYLFSLQAEKTLMFVRGPIEKKTFLIRPGMNEDNEAEGTDIQYSGYSSIHYVVKLGKAIRPPADLAPLRAELQLRTILEEAWGEIDHKYRYEFTRSGKRVPENVETGFRDLGLYLQAAARQADHLCEEVQRLNAPTPKTIKKARRTKKSPGPGTEAAVVVAPMRPATIADVLHARLKFTPSQRTLNYFIRRLDEHGRRLGRTFDAGNLASILTDNIVNRFVEIYNEVLGRDPFTDNDSSLKDLDALRLVNFALFSNVNSTAAAEAGLRAAIPPPPSRW